MQTRFVVLLISFMLAPFAWPLPPQIAIVPGSSIRGAELFREKACVECHSFNGVPQAQNPMRLAAALWNHSPEMWRAQKTRAIRPTLDSAETADLFAYFFSLAYSTLP